MWEILSLSKISTEGFVQSSDIIWPTIEQDHSEYYIEIR